VAAASSTVACDQAAKFAAQALAGNDPITVTSFLSFFYAENTGSAWSMFREHSTILAAFGIVAMVAMLLLRKHFETLLQKISAAIVFGGILGNTIDRIFRGHVIDFISLDLKFYRWPTFNVADGAICTGAAILLFTLQKNTQRK
jgi:signal peptidase II